MNILLYLYFIILSTKIIYTPFTQRMRSLLKDLFLQRNNRI